MTSTARGVILAGGASSRMGTDKALVEVAGIPMVERVGAALEQVAPGGVMVSGREGSLAGYPCEPDAYPGRTGPLGGIATTLLSHPLGVPLVSVAVDHAFVRVETLREILALSDGVTPVVPLAGGTRQVTVAVYGTGIMEVAQEVLAAGGSVQDVLDRSPFVGVAEDEWRAWGEDGRSWFSVDTREALGEGLDRYGTGLA